MTNRFGHWSAYPRGLDPDKAVGFVYMIVDKDDHRKYIGKKLFRGRGKKNKGKPSDWKRYCSSSTWLKNLIRIKGKSRFRFIILEQYHTLSGLSFGEVWSQIYLETPVKNEEFMNRFIDKITFKVVEPVTPRHKERLQIWVKKFPFPK